MFERLEGLRNFDPFHDIDPLSMSHSLEETDDNEPEAERIITSLLSLKETMQSRNTKTGMETLSMYVMMVRFDE